MGVIRPCKTHCIECGFEQAERIDRQIVNISVEELQNVNNFSPGQWWRRAEVNAACENWKKCSGVLCSRKMPVKLNWNIII